MEPFVFPNFDPVIFQIGPLAIRWYALAYIVGIEGMEKEEAVELLKELHAWQTRDEFVYRHQWQPGMLVMWDNRSVLHTATGGYEGHARLLHRTTIGAGRPARPSAVRGRGTWPGHDWSRGRRAPTSGCRCR